jgi:hypothetical protein
MGEVVDGDNSHAASHLPSLTYARLGTLNFLTSNHFFKKITFWNLLFCSLCLKNNINFS